MRRLFEREPVALAGALQTLLIAIIQLGQSFDWFTLNDAQRSAITAVWVAVTAVVTILVRQNVTPTADTAQVVVVTPPESP